MGTWVFPGSKAAGEWHLLPTPSSTEVKERVELYTLLPLWVFVASYRVNITFNFTAFWYITQYNLVDRYQVLEAPLQKPRSGQKNKHGAKGRCKYRKDGTGTAELDNPTNRPPSHALL